MATLSHSQLKRVEWCQLRPDKGGIHICYCQTCNKQEQVRGLPSVVAFINQHPGHKTMTRTFVNLN